MKKFLSHSKFLKRTYVQSKTAWEIKKFPYTNTQTYNQQEYIRIKMNTNTNCFMTPGFLSDLNAAMDNIDKDYSPDLPVVITSENEGLFQSGFDYGYLTTLDETALRSFLNHFTQTMERFYLWNRITSSAIKGNCVGQGMVFAMACDFKVGSSGDMQGAIAMPDISLGIPLPHISYNILKTSLVSPSPQNEVLLLGLSYTMDDAFECGLLTGQTEEVEDVERACCEAVTFSNTSQSYKSVGMMKRLLKEKNLLKLRDSGEAKEKDDMFIKHILDPDVKKMLNEGFNF